MRNPSITTRIAQLQRITEPLFLVEIGFTPPIYLSTRGPTLFDGMTYEQAMVEVLAFDSDDAGENQARLRLHSAYTDMAISQSMIDKPIKIGELWGDEASYDPNDMVYLLDGVISDAQIQRDYIDVQATQFNAGVSHPPGLFYDHQNIQPAGTRITIRTNTFIIQRANRYD